MDKKGIKGSVMLFLAAFFWGSTFVSQSQAMEYIEPFTYNCVRGYVGVLFLALVLLIVGFISKKHPIPGNEIGRKIQRNNSIKGGIICGFLYFGAATFQQFGIQYTTAGKAGFITACYIIFVPIVGLFIKRKTNLTVWFCVLLALFGFYLLSINDGFAISKGDFLVFMCALCYSVHILAVDHFASRSNGIIMSMFQFIVSATLSGIFMFVFENPVISAIIACAGPILYAGIFSNALAHTLQIMAQKYVKPAIASLLMSLESVFAALTGWIILGESFSTREKIGCVLIFAAVAVSSVPQSGYVEFFKKIFTRRHEITK